jgi:putative ABC transport system ATP-binding protein
VSKLIVDDLVVEYLHDGYAVRPLDHLGSRRPRVSSSCCSGPSGSGKTTLLSCLGGILTPTSGTIRLGDTEVTALRRRELERYRRDRVGFVFQAFT